MPAADHRENPGWLTDVMDLAWHHCLLLSAEPRYDVLDISHTIAGWGGAGNRLTTILTQWDHIPNTCLSMQVRSHKMTLCCA